ncbi:MAG: hypothetical protein PWP15_128 [Methanothermococcus sp.]|uniref:hypothetical protein n=1 Tax=Methanothermococcus TaxID=155862 RepID=UPI0003748BE0|nr:MULTISPECIES: hypothetical protein [Methanothermococcus]MDK2789621.1 hypothetical protein [Methanothermococcus sp.]MDK2988063.1 hypothetical protein [Methanothermococcus sp.]
MYNKIITAINEKRKLKIIYNGGDARTIEPHCYGNDTYDQKKLRAYQIKGDSNSGEASGWKLFIVENISSVNLLDERFEKPRPGYNPQGDTQIPHIICKIIE